MTSYQAPQFQALVMTNWHSLVLDAILMLKSMNNIDFLNFMKHIPIKCNNIYFTYYTEALLDTVINREHIANS